MGINNLTTQPTEADLEAEIHNALKVAFPWLKPGDLRHQTRFSFKFGRSKIEIDGASVSKAEARSDILIFHRDRPLAVLELKRRGASLTKDDKEQGLSYANMLQPRPPLVVVTNGNDIMLLASHTGDEWTPVSPSEAELAKLLEAAAKTAGTDLQHAVEVLLGPSSTIWTAAIRSTTALTINDLSGAWNDRLLPFVTNFVIPRAATQNIYAELKGDKRLVLLKGAPLVGKSCVLRELCSKTLQNEDFVILFLEADGNAGAGVFQSLANLLADALGWSVSTEHVRSWLRRLSFGTDPTLVLAIDGMGVFRDEVRRDIEELTSDAYGAKLRAVLAVDDTIVERLILNETRRKKTRIGRRAAVVSVGLLNDSEFRKTLDHLWNDHHIGVMLGGDAAPELRIPWILRAVVASFVNDPQYLDGNVAVIPPLLGLDLVMYVREQFKDDHDLRRQYQELAQAVLADCKDSQRPISLILESISAFVIRRKTLATIMEREDILSLMQSGYLKPRMHASGEYIFVPRLPELLLSEIALLLSNELNQKIRNDVNRAGDWIAAFTSKLPLGDLIGAQAILDYSSTVGHLPLDFITHLLNNRPHRQTIRPGTRGALHVPGAGVVELQFKENGLIVATAGGQETTILQDEDEHECEMYADMGSWLILSYLCRKPLIAQSHKDSRTFGRLDPTLLMEIGSSKIVLQRPSGDIKRDSHLTHCLPGHGSIVCHKAGIVEPITLSILQFLGRDGSKATKWIYEVVERKSLPLLARVHIALKQLSDTCETHTVEWAKKMIDEVVDPAFKNFPPLH